jgi:hypothetical protein
MAAPTLTRNLKTVQAHHSEATVETGGVLRMKDLPFSPGTLVEVIVLQKLSVPPSSFDALRGTVLRDDAPFAPATPPEDWDAAR